MQYTLQTAKKLIDEFCAEMYGAEDKADYSDLRQVLIAQQPEVFPYTHEVRAYLDLLHYRLVRTVYDVQVRETEFGNCRDFIEKCLKNLDYDDLLSVTEQEIQYAQREKSEPFEFAEKTEEAKVENLG